MFSRFPPSYSAHPTFTIILILIAFRREDFLIIFFYSGRFKRGFQSISREKRKIWRRSWSKGGRLKYREWNEVSILKVSGISYSGVCTKAFKRFFKHQGNFIFRKNVFMMFFFSRSLSSSPFPSNPTLLPRWGRSREKNFNLFAMLFCCRWSFKCCWSEKSRKMVGDMAASSISSVERKRGMSCEKNNR